MLNFLTRSILLGLLTALLVLLAVPSLRSNVMPTVLDTSPLDAASLQISFNQAVRNAAPAVVNIYSRKYVESDRSKLLTQGLGSGVIVSERATLSLTTMLSLKRIKSWWRCKMAVSRQLSW